MCPAFCQGQKQELPSASCLHVAPDCNLLPPALLPHLQDGVEELAHRREELLNKLVAFLGLDSEAAGVCVCAPQQYSQAG